ncbi:MAG: EamA family transporter [Clostridia bacterium]|nr:EamA family transporter [Clostridia bacterium]
MKKLSSLFIITAGIFWGCIGIFANELTAMGFNSLESSAIRLISCAFIFIIINFKKLKIRLKDMWQFVLIGIASILTMSITYFESIKHSSLSLASILLYTAPMMVTLMSALFYKEKMTKRKIICLMAAFAGIVMISGLDSRVNISTVGLIYGLLSAFSYALYSIIGKLILKKYEPITVSSYAFIFAAIGALFICDIPHMAEISVNTTSLWYTLIIMLGTGVVSAAIPYTLYTLGLKYVPAGKASILACVEPLTATIIGICFYGDRFGMVSAVGIVLIMTAVGVLSFPVSK